MDRPPVWNKGETKETSLGVKKISETFKKRKIDNFARWRASMIKLGKIRANYPPFKLSKELAFLIGLILGDGNISKFPRTERLLISLNARYPKLVKYSSFLLKRFFEKKPSVERQGNCIRIWVYQKNIADRLGIPSGSRRRSNSGIPLWIWDSPAYIIACLKGLFEAEGSLSIHLPTCTYNFAFSNRNQKLLCDVSKSLKLLGFQPEVRKYAIRLRKRKEVTRFKELINFRDYNFAG